MQDVVGLLFKYIQLLQKSGVCEWIFNEVHTVEFYFQFLFSVQLTTRLHRSGSSVESKFSVVNFECF